MSLATLLRDSERRWPNKAALWFAGRSWTFRELDDATGRIAAALSAAGVQTGDRVAMFTPNCIELVLGYFGIFKIGAIAVPLNYRYRPEEAEYALAHCGATTLIVHEKLLDEVDSLPLAGMGISRGYVIGGAKNLPFLPFETLLNSSASANAPQPSGDNQPATILYTSGSTAKPKGVTHSYQSIWNNCAIQTHSFALTPDDVHLVSTAACHCAAFGGQLLPSLWSGGTCVLTHVPQPDEFVAAIETYGVTRTQMLPASLEDIVEYLEHKPGAQLQSWRVCTAGGDVVPIELQQRFKKLTGFEVTELYGMTEAVTTFTNPPFGAKRFGSFGKPVDQTQGRIVDVQGNDLPPDQPGELIVQTPSMLLGYWNDPAATAAAIRDGWLYTGDLARRDADGYFWFVGRKKEIIIRAGSNISPMEIESVLDSHHAVHLSGVVGKQDAHFGQIVIAYVQLRDDASVKPTEAELRQFVAERIAAYKVPERIHVVAQLPLNSTGKVDRQQLHAVVQQESA
ncbi:MAG TPA: class I adenylate-forming enzyme family protein [Pirellulales bacterium]|jgi:acyl-CoA synthetase (AMP-forming)/AMP-acid ligase II|nr:class I adenylate-forming enzyme family protein [Pirellulales bacterium]